MILALLATLAQASPELETDVWRVDVKGSVKASGSLTLPYESWLFAADPLEWLNGDHSAGLVDPPSAGLFLGRLGVEADAADRVAAVAHHELAARTGSPASLGAFGVDRPASPELLRLSWSAFDGATTVEGRTDRLLVRVGAPRAELTLGRQPVSFGHGMFFTPLDLVNPFHPAAADTEYKPGVDAVRGEAYWGLGGKASAVAAYAGAGPPDGRLLADDVGWESAVLAATAQGTVVTTDVGGLVGVVRGDLVGGVTAAGGVGPVALHGDVTVTLPERLGSDAGGGEPFVRAVLGGFWSTGGRWGFTAEGYLQTLGSTDPAEGLALLATDRYLRGEVWTTGVAYLGASTTVELFPTLNASLAVLANLTDPSALLAPGIAWSVADDADVGVGGSMGLGPRPDDPPAAALVDPAADLLALTGVRSEMGLYPTTLWLQLRTWF